MARSPSLVVARLSGAVPEATGVLVSFDPEGGRPARVEDHLVLGPEGDLAAVQGVGRLLRILRAGRVAAPKEPYALAGDPERAAALLARCLGARVRLRIARRLQRGLTLWTESGVEQIGEVVDYEERDGDLAVRRRGAATLLRIPRRSLLRYEASSHESYEVTGVELV